MQILRGILKADSVNQKITKGTDFALNNLHFKNLKI